MKKKEKWIKRSVLGSMAALAVMAVVGCAEEVTQIFSDSTKVEVTASFGSTDSQSLTRAADGLDNATSGFSLLTAANNSSKVRVMVDANDGTYSSYDYSITGTTAITAPATPPAFPSGVNSVNVYGWYPNVSLTDFSVDANQSSTANYCLSDLMVAAGDACTRSGSNVTHASALSFTHVMAKLKVSLTLASGVTVKAVKLKSMSPQVTVTPQTTSNAVTSFTVGTAGGTATDITLLSGGSLTSASAAADKVLCGVFPPQSKNGAFLEITASYNSGAAQTITYSFGSAKTFARANEYTMNISLDGTNVTTGTVDISDWNVESGTVEITPGGGSLALQTSASGSNGYVTFDAIADQLYTGSALTPTPRVRVTINGTLVTMVSGTDFDFSYSNNVSSGVATVNVTGKNIFSGTVSKTFNINDCHGADISTAAVGNIICSHGKVHAATTAETLPNCSGSRAAVVAYIDGDTKWAISIKNAQNDTWNNITSDGTTAGANKNTNCVLDPAKLGDLPAAPSGMTWYVLNKANYETMFVAMGSTTGDNDGKTYDSNVNTKITNAGGQALSGRCWSTSEGNSDYGWYFYESYWNSGVNGFKANSLYVRPVLAW